ncbi:MAG: hypothetical protein EPN26_01025, partial [Rhodospirillales bacterium]
MFRGLNRLIPTIATYKGVRPMPKQIDYYYSLVSPWSLIGHARLIDIAKRHGATIAFKPVNLAKIFPVTGGSVFKDRHPSRLAYRLVELER